MNIKMICTRKYYIDDTRGWKLFLDVPDGVDYEGQGQFAIVTKNAKLSAMEIKDSVEVQVIE